MRKPVVLGAVVIAVVAAGVAARTRISPGPVESKPATVAKGLDLSAVPADPPEGRVRMLFIHHSCGGQLLAPLGPDKDEHCIYASSQNGGGLRPMLDKAGYEVHEASYDSVVGHQTDMFDWLPKLRTQMDRILITSHQDETYADGRKNQIVVFKSCFPNNAFVGEGTLPGNPAGPDLTVANAKATLSALLPEIGKHPETLFVYVTPPPLAPRPEPMALWRFALQRVRGGGADAAYARQAALARELNNWVVSPEGWLSQYKGSNLVVFDYYGVLTDGRSNFSAFASEDGTDSHPLAEGNRRAAEAFVPLLNRAVRRAGLTGRTARADGSPSQP